VKAAIILSIIFLAGSFSSPLTYNSSMIDVVYAQADAAKQAQEKAKEASQAAKESAQEKSQQKSETKSQQEQSSSQASSSQQGSQASSAQQGSQQQVPAQKEQTEKQIPPTQRQETQQERPVEKIPQQVESSDERHIVVLNEGVSPRELAQSHGLIPAFVYSKALNGMAGKIPADVIEKLRQDPRVKFVEKDQTSFAFAQSLPTGIDRINAELSIAKIDGVDERINADIAIIDTGVSSHSDLNVVSRVDCTNDLNPCSRGGSDTFGHGTHVAGTAAALDNDYGVVGVAPGANIWSVKVLGDDGSGWISWLIAGIDYVTANTGTIDVANLSLGCECKSAALDDAISKSVSSGVVYVVAAGNEAKDVSSFSPANHPDVITVSAIADFDGKPGSNAASTCLSDIDDTFAFFSNYGREVEIAAPGTCILSTWHDGGYGILSGTSMAAPHVAGTVALYLSENPKPQSSSDVRDVRQKIIEMAFDANSSDGYSSSDDPDGIAEPLVNAGAMTLSLEQQEETQPIEEEQLPQEEQVEEEREDDSDSAQKIGERGLEIAEKMKQRGLAIAESIQQDLTTDEKMQQRGLAIAEKMQQRGLDIAARAGSQSGSEIAEEMSGEGMGIASEMRKMGLDIAQSMAMTGINIGETMSEREVIAEVKSEVIIEELEQKIQGLEERIQSLLEKLEQGSYHIPENVREDSYKSSFNVSFEGQSDDGAVVGSVFLENVATREDVAKFKVTGGQVLVGESVAYDVLFGKARIVKGPASDILMIIAQIIDAEENVSTIRLAVEASELKDNITQGIADFNLGPQSKISNKRIAGGTGQIAEI